MADDLTKKDDPLERAYREMSQHNKPLGFAIPIIPPIPNFQIPVNANLASEFYKRLVEWINNFDGSLDEAHEVGVRLVNFGQTVTFHLQDLGYWNPSLISFNGSTEQGEPVELIQHVSQISILLMKVKRQDPTKPKKPIGFVDTNK